MTVPVDILPGSIYDDGTAEWPVQYKMETEAQKAWEFSQTRISLSYTRTPKSNPIVTVTMPNGEQQQFRSGGVDQDLYMTSAAPLFDQAYYPYFTMVQRGAYWIGIRPDISEGDVFPSTGAMTATAEMPQPTVVAQKDGGYTAQPMRALAQMPKVAEDETGDVEINTLPMEALATFTNYSKVISAAPMTATAEMVESFDMVHTSGEQVVLTLHSLDLVTLYLKEEE
jgi:hypothetical protein